jgi:hypothetical protein
MRALLVIAWLGACGARPAAIAATSLSGDAVSMNCTADLPCAAGGGKGSLVVPLVVVGAIVIAIASSTYVYDLVRPPAHVPLSAPRHVP